MLVNQSVHLALGVWNVRQWCSVAATSPHFSKVGQVNPRSGTDLGVYHTHQTIPINTILKDGLGFTGSTPTILINKITNQHLSQRAQILNQVLLETWTL